MTDLYRGDKPALELLEDRVADIPGKQIIGSVSNHGYHLLKRTHTRDNEKLCVISIYFESRLFSRHESEFRTQLALPVMLIIMTLTYHVHTNLLLLVSVITILQDF